MVHEDPTPTRHYDLTGDVILGRNMQAIFQGSPSEVKATLQEIPSEYQDMLSVFEHRFVNIMTVAEYLAIVDLDTNNVEFAPMPKRKWNQ
ncbi:hypothetical protein SEA_MADAMATO_77 [Streptomyces phage Madamato]|nr:hypothetical protein SEA_MADAMATO_77 [Streptomyces phage Madamato]